MTMSRRGFLALTLGAVSIPLGRGPLADRFIDTTGLASGQFIWQPAISRSGPVLVVVTLSQRIVHVFRGGIPIGIAKCSLSLAMNRIPAGVFMIEAGQRQPAYGQRTQAGTSKDRLIWRGTALNASNLAGFPASLGCIRLPNEFARLLFKTMPAGSAVIISPERTLPDAVVSLAPLIGAHGTDARREIAQCVLDRAVVTGSVNNPAAQQTPALSVVISAAEKMAYVHRDGEMTEQLAISVDEPGRRFGTQAYTLIGPTPDNACLQWMAFSLGKNRSETEMRRASPGASLERVSFRDKSRSAEIAKALHPGSLLLLTDRAEKPATRKKAANFVIFTNETGGGAGGRRQRRRVPKPVNEFEWLDELFSWIHHPA